MIDINQFLQQQKIILEEKILTNKEKQREEKRNQNAKSPLKIIIIANSNITIYLPTNIRLKNPG